MKVIKGIFAILLFSTFLSFTTVECGCSVPLIGAPGDHGTYYYQGDGDCCQPIGAVATFSKYHFGEESPYHVVYPPVTAAMYRCHNC